MAELGRGVVAFPYMPAVGASRQGLGHPKAIEAAWEEPQDSLGTRWVPLTVMAPRQQGNQGALHPSTKRWPEGWPPSVPDWPLGSEALPRCHLCTWLLQSKWELWKVTLSNRPAKVDNGLNRMPAGTEEQERSSPLSLPRGPCGTASLKWYSPLGLHSSRWQR